MNRVIISFFRDGETVMPKSVEAGPTLYIFYINVVVFLSSLICVLVLNLSMRIRAAKVKARKPFNLFIAVFYMDPLSPLIVVLVLLISSRRVQAAKVKARKPFKARRYSNVEFGVMGGKYSKLCKDMLAITTRNVTKDELSKLSEDIQLATGTRVPSTWLDKYKVLPRQTGHRNQPPEWILIDLVVWYGVTTVALRIDNLYLVGFTNRNGHWYTFDEYTELIPGSTGIEFPGSYAGLGYKGLDGRAKLCDLPLNVTTVSTAVQKLLDYNSLLPDKEELKQALATLVLVICEAARFTEISTTVSSGWNSVGYISRSEILVQWKDLSVELLLGWEDNNRTMVGTLEKFGIKEKEAAYLPLHVLIWPRWKDLRKKKKRKIEGVSG